MDVGICDVILVFAFHVWLEVILACKAPWTARYNTGDVARLVLCVAYACEALNGLNIISNLFCKVLAILGSLRALYSFAVDYAREIKMLGSNMVFQIRLRDEIFTTRVFPCPRYEFRTFESGRSRRRA